VKDGVAEGLAHGELDRCAMSAHRRRKLGDGLTCLCALARHRRQLQSD
jgi:hypothetical protein